MERYYGDANDKFVGSIVFYAPVGGGIFTDAACTKAATTEELEHAYKTGYLMFKDLNSGANALVRPLSMCDNDSETAHYVTFEVISEGGSPGSFTNKPSE